MAASLTISINRTSLSLSALSMSALLADGTALGIVGYQEPAKTPRVGYAPSSNYEHGDTVLSWSWQQSILNFDVVPVNPATEAVARDLIDQLVTAVSRVQYQTTVTVNGVAKVWTCDVGSVTPAGARTLVDLKTKAPVWAVSIPCYPIPA